MNDKDYYIKKVIAVLGAGEKRFREMFREAEENGILLHMIGAEEFKSCFGNSDREIEGLLREEGSLWVTDDRGVAGYFFDRSENILIWIHEQNKQEDFSRGKYIFEGSGEISAVYLDRIYRRFHDLPWLILESARCLVRESTEQDVDFFYEIYKDPEITEYMEDLYDDPEKEREYIRQYREHVYRFYEFGVWTVVEKESGEIIGRAGLSMRDECDVPELGFVIGKRWQRKGFAYEVLDAILNYAVKEFQMDCVQALVEPSNIPSVMLCRKLGFVKECEVSVGDKRFERMLVYINLFT